MLSLYLELKVTGTRLGVNAHPHIGRAVFMQYRDYVARILSDVMFYVRVKLGMSSLAERPENAVKGVETVDTSICQRVRLKMLK